MGLKLVPAKHADMHEMVEVVYIANSDPRDPFVDLCLPGLGDWSSSTLEEGIDEVTKNYLEEWKASSTQTWLKVVDENTGKITSVSRWELHEKNPFADGLPHINAAWLPEGSKIREYAEWLINTRYGQASERCQSPHVWLDICATLPEFRRRGAASQALQWGINKADEMDVEAFIEASIEGAQLYERFGFRTIHIMDLRKEATEDQEWASLAEEYPLHYRWMEREKKSNRNV
ncbi:GNAT acetyltransferase-like protein [Aaosphaeria arxii CBS 175.79]|uniref:GNAT acetyltransferase-like protein n=1 Tax=Aaosphaeria arxii CBS 175.79 TaxID=1450172 RepID=A0A6A5XEP7_9PLEO|nr:GNAT acetyltransferase-like protein [Aaosphaeria arxii CBS 175.79]KAF2011277.1 GNAT acetyltransferase-like protein [Aaosphaeria arxii CBS 175.79]